MTGLDWTDSDMVRELLAELDACERSSDHWYGKGDIAKAFSERCEEIDTELDAIRSEAVNDVADRISNDRYSDEWADAWEEADSEAESVDAACQRARRLHMGDKLIELVAAA